VQTTTDNGTNVTSITSTRKSKLLYYYYCQVVCCCCCCYYCAAAVDIQVSCIHYSPIVIRQLTLNRHLRSILYSLCSSTTSLSTLSTLNSRSQQLPVIVIAEFIFSSCSQSPWKTNPNSKVDMLKQVIIIIECVHVSRASCINTFPFFFSIQSRLAACASCSTRTRPRTRYLPPLWTRPTRL